MASTLPSLLQRGGEPPVAYPSRFELLPGEIRNKIYTELLCPSINTYRETDLQHTYNRVRIHHDILLANKKIYGEAHAILYAKLGPVLVVRGVPYNNSLCNMMGRLEFRPMYILSGSYSPRGAISTLDFTWRDTTLRVQDPLHSVDSRNPNMVLFGNRHIAEFIKWLRVLKVNDIHRSESFLLSFNFGRPNNALGAYIMEDSFLRRAQLKFLQPFDIFKGFGIIHEVRGLVDREYEVEYLAIVNHPIIWLRSEMLNLADLWVMISQQGDTLDPNNLASEFLKYDFILEQTGKANSSYNSMFMIELPADHEDGDLQPLKSLVIINQLAHYNRALFYLLLLNSSDRFPIQAQIVLDRDINLGSTILYELKNIYDYGLINSRAKILNSYQLSMVGQMVVTFEAMLNPHWDSEAARQYLRQSVCLASQYPVRVSALNACLDDLCLEVLMKHLPTKPLKFDIPTQHSSAAVVEERTVLRERNYAGSLLLDEVLEIPTNFSRNDPWTWSIVDVPTAEELQARWTNGRKLWLGFGNVFFDTIFE